MNAKEFEIAFYEAIFKWVSGGKVGPDPRGEWEYSDIFGKWHQTFAPSVPEWDLTAYRWKLPKNRTVTIETLMTINAELLEALKPFAVYGRMGSWDIEVEAAMAAIAKATQKEK